MNHESDLNNDNIAKDLSNQMVGLGEKGGKVFAAKAGNVLKKMAVKVGKKVGKMAIIAGKKAILAVGKAIMSVLTVLSPYLIAIGAVVLVIVLGWYLLFETRGAEGRYTFVPDEENALAYNEKGYYSVTGFGGKNKMVLDFYKYFSNQAYYQIFGDDHAKLEQTQKTDNPIFDEYRQEEIYTPSPNFLFVLDEYLHKGKMRYPEQFVQPINYDPATLSLKPLVDEEGNVNVESKAYGEDGLPNGQKEISIHDYGIASIYKYKKAQRTLTVEGKYVKKEVWDESCECKKIKEIDEDFVYTMDGFPENIWLMDKAVTFAMEVQLAYEERKMKYRDLEDKISTPNENGNKVKYGEHIIYKEEKHETIDENGNIVTETRKVEVGRVPLYKYRVGAVYETKPFPDPQNNIEKKYGLDYLKDYMYHYEAWIPKSVMEEFDFSKRVGQMLYTDLKIGEKVGTAAFMKLYQKFDLFEQYAEMYGVDPYIMLAIAMQESGGREDAEGGGMFQIAGTGARTVTAKNVITGQTDSFTIYNEQDRKNFEKSLRWATMYYASLVQMFDGDPLKGLQAYNFGPAPLLYIKEHYPEAWETTMWMNYREEARLHYGGQNTRSAGIWCNPELLDRPGVKNKWGDSCYVEGVLRYYMGDKLDDLENHDSDQKSWWDKIVDFISNPFKKDYKDNEPRFHFEHRMGVQEIDWTIKAAGTFEKNVLFSELYNENLDTLEFWESGFSTKTGNLDVKQFLTLVPGADGYIQPLDPDVYPNVASLITSRFGFRVDPVTGKQGAFHAGIDIGVPVGTPLYAIADGVVEIAVGNRTHSKTSYGNYVKIRHEDGNYTLYGHMNDVYVKVGQQVKQGQFIGTSGNSGKSTGPHLHFEFWRGDERIDPYFIVVRPDLHK